LPIGTGRMAAGMGGKGEPAQVDIGDTEHGHTIAYPVRAPEGMRPWSFKGAISAAGCVTWCGRPALYFHLFIGAGASGRFRSRRYIPRRRSPKIVR
jgi:hypothetical protein